MLHPFNRCELTTMLGLEKVEPIRAALDRHGIEHQVKVINRNSPSVFNLGTRETAGVLFQNPKNDARYVIYVKRADLSRAQSCTGVGPLR